MERREGGREKEGNGVWVVFVFVFMVCVAVCGREGVCAGAEGRQGEKGGWLIACLLPCLANEGTGCGGGEREGGREGEKGEERKCGRGGGE